MIKLAIDLGSSVTKIYRADASNGIVLAEPSCVAVSGAEREIKAIGKDAKKLVGRVNGANFTAIYGRSKAMGYRNITLPEGHTWESYTRFLLATLPARLRENYVRKFKTSIQFWHNVGGGLGEEAIRELKEHGYKIRRNGVSIRSFLFWNCYYQPPSGKPGL